MAKDSGTTNDATREGVTPSASIAVAENQSAASEPVLDPGLFGSSMEPDLMVLDWYKVESVSKPAPRASSWLKIGGATADFDLPTPANDPVVIAEAPVKAKKPRANVSARKAAPGRAVKTAKKPAAKTEKMTLPEAPVVQVPVVEKKTVSAALPVVEPAAPIKPALAMRRATAPVVTPAQDIAPSAKVPFDFSRIQRFPPRAALVISVPAVLHRPSAKSIYLELMSAAGLEPKAPVIPQLEPLAQAVERTLAKDEPVVEELLPAVSLPAPVLTPHVPEARGVTADIVTSETAKAALALLSGQKPIQSVAPAEAPVKEVFAAEASVGIIAPEPAQESDASEETTIRYLDDADRWWELAIFNELRKDYPEVPSWEANRARTRVNALVSMPVVPIQPR